MIRLGMSVLNIFRLLNISKESWTWGPNGHGAILLVNCDSEKTSNKSPDTEDVRISKVSGNMVSVQSSI